MEMLHVENGLIVNPRGLPVRLRGVCAGGWMNMESFIDGFPGTESSLRATMAEVLGPAKAAFFFDRWLDVLFAEEDIGFIKRCGASVVRLPLNYRHFESDLQPFHYLEAGFRRLDQVLRWCEQHGLYAILDLHAVQGWQNPDWHSDNPTHQALFWKHLQFQDRFIALWEEFARRYAGNPVVAGYDLMNEPLSNEPSEQIHGKYRPDWAAFNQVYRRAVQAIRAIDPDHIIFLEGDGFSSKFDGLEEPFAENLAYSSHNYTRAGWGPGAYPGHHREGYWDRAMVEQVFSGAEGTRFTQQHGVPLWVGEFGPVFNGAPEDRPSRLRGLEDTLDVYDQYGAHWTSWTYKDTGVMGWVYADPRCEFIERTAVVTAARRELSTDTWMYWLPATPAKSLLGDLAGLIVSAAGEVGFDDKRIQGQLAKLSLAGVAGGLMQLNFARVFKDCSETEIDRILQSFAFKHCAVNTDLVGVIRENLAVKQQHIEPVPVIVR